MQNQEKEERERWLWLLLVGIGMFFTDRLLAWTVYSIRLLYLVPLLVSGVYFLYLCIQISRHKFDRRKCNQLEVWMMEAKRWMLSGFWLSCASFLETLFLDMTKFLSVDMANAFHRSITFYFWVLLWIGYFLGFFSGRIREKYMKRHPKKEMSRRKKILLLLGIAAVVIIAFTLRCLGDLMVIFQGAGVMAVILFWYSGYEEGQRFRYERRRLGIYGVVLLAIFVVLLLAIPKECMEFPYIAW